MKELEALKNNKIRILEKNRKIIYVYNNLVLLSKLTFIQNEEKWLYRGEGMAAYPLH